MEAWHPLVTGLMTMRELDTRMSTFSNTGQVRKAGVKADSLAAVTFSPHRL
ncbi:hypothetical protein [Duganella sp. Leaf61]|uniref:hypothetical protein n=1 Tax=Duganella sp. Leaf61 TaxID=1736227 RepID=UPI000A81B521|nr:hypothetical protein [Duganella sp. Leaf61]